MFSLFNSLLLRPLPVQDPSRLVLITDGTAPGIRTYNYAQNRVTDHRIGLTLHRLDAIMEGDLDELLTALRQHHQAALLDRS